MAYILEPYDAALRHILDNGVLKTNRTGINSLSVFGYQTRYNISEYFPVLTGRRVYPKSIFAELLWIISGSTNVRDLQKLGSHIWDEWQDKNFEQKRGYIEGSLGPVYGFQLRYFNGKYGRGCPDDYCLTYGEHSGHETKVKIYGNGGFNQLEQMVRLLHEDLDSRRNLFSLWNPMEIENSKLPPCHILFQVYVHDGKLSGQLYQRSADAYLGMHSNVMEYSALLYMLAQQSDLTPFEFIHSIGDMHLYLNSLDATKEYLGRPKPDSPKLKLNKAKDIYSYLLEDFVIENYNPLRGIKVEVAV